MWGASAPYVEGSGTYTNVALCQFIYCGMSTSQTILSFGAYIRT